MTVVAEASLLLTADARSLATEVGRAEGELERLGREAASVSGEARRLTGGLTEAEQAARRTGQAMAEAGRQAGQLAAASAGAGNVIRGRFGSVAQQVGFQVGDFATQVASGQSALVALTQQGAQLAGFFGPLGAVIGAVGAVAGALAVAWFNAADAGESLGDVADRLGASLDPIADINRRLETASGELREALLAEREAYLLLADAALKAAQAKLADAQADLRLQALRAIPQTTGAAVDETGLGTTIDLGAATETRVQAEIQRLRERDLERNAELATLERRVIEQQAALRGSPDAIGARPARGSGGGGRPRADRAEIEAEREARRRVQEAERTAAEVSREYARSVGLSYAEASDAIERWRTDALADLALLGGGHEELAGQVEAVAAVRLGDAYRQDLERRDDWRSGVERGLLDIADSHRTMADVAEETVTGAFGRLEDAFVSLATTGKAETEDLVEFALRQFYRLAEQAALATVQGGGGGAGGIIGSLLGPLIGGLFGGGGSAISGVVSNFGTFASIHTGGLVANAAARRRVDPSVFGAAPRLHEGGLLPRERPAILESDERVLTVAQQAATARTISALAGLAGRPAAAAEPRGVVVNIIGAEREPRVQTREEGGTTTIDVLFEAVEGRLARSVASGRGPLTDAIGQRFQVRPRGGV